MIRRSRSPASAVLLALVFGSASFALADTVVLKNGRRIEGRIVGDNEREVTLQTKEGLYCRFERRMVASVEKDARPPAEIRPGSAEDIDVPDGASEDEVERLRPLIPKLRDTSRRWLDAKKEHEDLAGKEPEKARLAEEREKEFLRQLEQLKAAREAIERSAATRLERTARNAREDADQLHADTNKLKLAQDAPGLAERAQKLRARLPESERDPRYAPLMGEALYAMECAADVDLDAAQAKAADARVALLVRAGQHLGWCVENAEGGARDRKRAADALGDAHRAAGPKTAEVERALVGIQAYAACAALIEDRLGERRWGAEVGATEAGQYRFDLEDGRVFYGDDPTTRFARTASERRDRNELRATKDGSQLVKATRWYELVYDPRKKRWARETQATTLELQKLVSVLRAAEESVDALAQAREELRGTFRVAAERHDALVAARKRVEAGEAGEETLDHASKELNDHARVVSAAQDVVSQAQAALAARQREIDELVKEIEQSRHPE